eukprot:11162712-Lingulodinium_polyedra.AAC.1
MPESRPRRGVLPGVATAARGAMAIVLIIVPVRGAATPPAAVPRRAGASALCVGPHRGMPPWLSPVRLGGEREGSDGRALQ